MHYKKLMALFLSSMLTLTACSGEADSDENKNESTKETIEETVNESAKGTIEQTVTESMEETVEETQPDSQISLDSNDAIKEARALVWEEYIAEIIADETRKNEVDSHSMNYGDVTMKYGMQIKGDPGENGYPLYIALHGGGSSDTPTMNDQQWNHMTTYYSNSVKNAIYINPRGVRDTWDTHANPESYPLYDRLIENMIAFYNVDPNKVYLVGFSAGGDGVYMITPKMTDRFAAANMSAGHPNGINLTNLYNMPIQLQVGILDSAYDRNTVTAEYDAVLENLANTYGGGYIHNTNVHVKYGHNFYDNKAVDQEVLADPAAWLESGDTTSVMKDTNAIHFLSEYTRNPLPERVIWEFTNRANMRETESFYWLSASYDVKEGMIIASYDTASNSITIEENSANGPVTILINEDMLDVFSPITVHTPSESYEVTVTPEYELLKNTTYERGDKNYQFIASIVIE